MSESGQEEEEEQHSEIKDLEHCSRSKICDGHRMDEGWTPDTGT